MDIGFVGLGNMGAAMARNLIKAGHRLTVYNRSRDKAEALAADGAVIADSPAEAAGAGIVLTMLANDEALYAVTEGPDGILAGLPADGILVSMSTVSLAATRRCSWPRRSSAAPTRRRRPSCSSRSPARRRR